MLWNAIGGQRPDQLSFRELMFHHNNARPFRAQLIMEKSSQLGWEHLQHQPYSRDLGPGDLHLLILLETGFGWTLPRNEVEVKLKVKI